MASAVALPRLRLISFRNTMPQRFVLLMQCIDAPPTVRRHLFWCSWAIASWEHWTDLLHMMPSMMRAFILRDSTPGTDDGGWRWAGLIHRMDAFGNDGGVAIAGGA